MEHNHEKKIVNNSNKFISISIGSIFMIKNKIKGFSKINNDSNNSQKENIDIPEKFKHDNYYFNEELKLNDYNKSKTNINNNNEFKYFYQHNTKKKKFKNNQLLTIPIKKINIENDIRFNYNQQFKYNKYGSILLKNKPIRRNYYKCKNKNCNCIKHEDINLNNNNNNQNYNKITYINSHNHPPPPPYSDKIKLESNNDEFEFLYIE
jgi:hypothetical protein